MVDLGNMSQKRFDLINLKNEYSKKLERLKVTKIPKNLLTKEQLDALAKIGIKFDFKKYYSSDEIGDIEEALQAACLDYGFEGGEPNEHFAFWEKICDSFTGYATDKFALNDDIWNAKIPLVGLSRQQVNQNDCKT